MKSSWRLADHWSGFDYIPLNTFGSLYLGAWETDEEEILLIDELSKRKINLIVGLGFKSHPILCFPQASEVKSIACPVEDFPSEADELLKFINNVLEQIHIALITGENVYVHCHAGISRSSAVVIAYLIEYHDYTLEDAMDYVRRYRPKIQPNWGFMRMLENWKKVPVYDTSHLTIRDDELKPTAADSNRTFPPYMSLQHVEKSKKSSS